MPGAIFDHLRLDLRLRQARRREREALARLGEAAAAGTDPADFAAAQLVSEVRVLGSLGSWYTRLPIFGARYRGLGWVPTPLP
ncbi:MAG TPA: hypothetical protein VGJ36_01950 [Gemmatimonadales bacterium]